MEKPWHKDRHWNPPDFEARRRVIASACRARTGELVVGPRHWDECMHRMKASMKGIDWAFHTQGFIDQFGFFMDREEAYVVAAHQNQIVNPDAALAGNRLCSECLY